MAFGPAVVRQALAASALAAACAVAGPALAQDGASRAVVQPLPPPEAAQLSEALRRLAADPRDLEALLAAGNASLKLDDIDAALGFFARADELAPGDPRTKAGLAAAMVREENPFDALRLFDEAERAGASLDELAGERALAYDLVGDNARAQRLYREVLDRGEDAEISRRLALSLAIAGDEAGMERVLLPMLQRRDLAAYRARAFALAILGKVEEAQTISDAVMPPSMAARIAPYLRHMPQLTRAQQAAAANLGNFPRTAEIGRDDPRVPQYAGAQAPVAAPAQSADARLVPAGEPLGPAADDGRRRPDRPEGEQVALAQAEAAGIVEAAPGAVSEPGFSLAATEPVEEPPAAIPTAPAEVPEPALALADPEPAVETSADVPQPAFDLAQIAGSRQAPPSEAFELAPVAESFEPAVLTPVAAEPALEQVVAAVEPEPAPEPSEAAPTGVAGAFADFEFSLAPATPVAGAVDLARIEPPRERPAPSAAARAAHPARHWVQLATARDRERLGFDFRRIARESGAALGDSEGYLARWGETNRLLTGPFRSEAAAQALVTRLDEAGVKSFTFTSEEGEEVSPLSAR